MQTDLGNILESKGTAVRTVDPACTVSDAVKAMADEGIGALPVVDYGILVGIFSERDVLIRLVNNRLDPDATAVAEVMSKNPVTGTRGMTLFEAMELMSAKRFRHLPIVHGDKLIGIVSMRDITARIIHDQRQSIEVMIRARVSA